MAKLFNNRELRSITAKLIALVLFLLIAFLLLASAEQRNIGERIADQNAAVIGSILIEHPELEQAIVKAFTSPSSAQDIQRGAAALSKYGYTTQTPLQYHPVFKIMYKGQLIKLSVFVLLSAALILALVIAGYAAIYKKVAAISSAAERVVDGDFNVALPAEGEGAFAILGHRFNQMANRLKLNMEQLKAEKVFLKNIISDISHQLKTPLSTLVIYNELMSDDPGMDEQSRTNFIELGRQQLQRLEWLIQSLLKMARLEAGSIVFKKVKTSLLETVNSAVLLLEERAKESEVHIAIQLKTKEASFTGDGEWLSEALINIIKNSIEHSVRGGEISVILTQTPLSTVIEIVDCGEGIEEADLPHIFERFYKSGQGVKPNSIGIGLALSKAIVEGQGGSITVRSKKGQGSVFAITFLRTLGA